MHCMFVLARYVEVKHTFVVLPEEKEKEMKKLQRYNQKCFYYFHGILEQIQKKRYRQERCIEKKGKKVVISFLSSCFVLHLKI